MTRFQRKLLFWASVVIFIFGVLPLILFSLGYRFSFEEFKWLPAGGLSISSIPSTGSRIYVDGELVQETNLFSRRAFLQGLTPGQYDVKIERDGYFSWSKNLTVLPEKVTDVRAVLVRDNQAQSEMLTRGDFVNLHYVHTDNEVFGLESKAGTTTFFSVNDRELLPFDSVVATSSVAIPSAVSAFIEGRKDIFEYDYDPQGERLLWWGGGKLWVRWFAGEEYLPLYTEEEEILVLDEEHLIRRGSFYPEQEAIIAAYANTVVVAELDGRNRRNVFAPYKGKSPNFLVIEDQLFVLDNGNLIVVPLE
ncbi:MAG: PEGA domain-containing protein [bacterium]|nr:PEGA domain-containing protein [bacterium]